MADVNGIRTERTKNWEEKDAKVSRKGKEMSNCKQLPENSKKKMERGECV
jgi:hypothetical protein